MRRILSLALGLPVALIVGCSANSIDNNADGGPRSCLGRGCDINYQCPADKGPTTLTGVVTIPAGTLPLYNAKVYIPAFEVPPAPISGATCDRCDNGAPNDAAARTTTDVNGRFTLTNVPHGSQIPLVISVGKWRRVTYIDNIVDCTTTNLELEKTRLPRNQSEGNIPKIALTTGYGDALECLLRKQKLGIDDKEFTNPEDGGRVNLYVGGATVSGQGASQYAATFASASAGKSFPSAVTWWSDGKNWQKYDVVLLSCEATPIPAQKPDAARYALQDYIDNGGRVFASHWQNAWFNPVPLRDPKPSTQMGALSDVASFLNLSDPMPPLFQDDSGNELLATINKAFPRAAALNTWLQQRDVSGTLIPPDGTLPLRYSRQSLKTRDENLTKDWVDLTPSGTGYTTKSQYFSFNAPIGATEGLQCGQMVFTDIHVNGDRNGGDLSRAETPFPGSCVTTSLSPQEKALIFMLFDLTDCLQPIIG